MPIPKNINTQTNNKRTYKYAMKTNPITKKCKIVKYTFLGDRLIDKRTAYKNLDLEIAKDAIYNLERGRLPMF